jgi:hypothetical protein
MPTPAPLGDSGLQILVGAWAMEAAFPGADPVSGGTATFEPILGGAYLLQRTATPDPEVPDGLMVIGSAPGGEGYIQHYFDSRGVTRVYSMTLHEVQWTLLRETPDFSALDFSQRFVGRFSADGDAIDGQWEARPGSGDWELDFGLRYTRLSGR